MRFWNWVGGGSRRSTCRCGEPVRWRGAVPEPSRLVRSWDASRVLRRRLRLPDLVQASETNLRISSFFYKKTENFRWIDHGPQPWIDRGFWFLGLAVDFCSLILMGWTARPVRHNCSPSAWGNAQYQSIRRLKILENIITPRAMAQVARGPAPPDGGNRFVQVGL